MGAKKTKRRNKKILMIISFHVVSYFPQSTDQMEGSYKVCKHSWSSEHFAQSFWRIARVLQEKMEQINHTNTN